MLFAAAFFFILSLIAAVLGFGGVAAFGWAKIVFLVSLALFVVLLLVAVFRGSV
jgi:uncharacterized membrane protein YtjA (UPF0391 family)